MTTSPDRIPLWREEIPSFLVSYLLDDGKEHPCILVIPGGGYQCLCEPSEGEPTAKKFNSLGFHAFVLHYRGAPHRFPAPQLDAMRAMKILRGRSREWRIAPHRIAALGFSAGGHLAASLGTAVTRGLDASDGDRFDAESHVPDALILCYGVLDFRITRCPAVYRNLLGAEIMPKAALRYSPAHRVTGDTPPAFLWHTIGDQMVGFQESLSFAKSMAARQRPCELHLFPNGEHGTMLGLGTPDLAIWPLLVRRFLRARFGKIDRARYTHPWQCRAEKAYPGPRRPEFTPAEHELGERLLAKARRIGEFVENRMIDGNGTVYTMLDKTTRRPPDDAFFADAGEPAPDDVFAAVQGFTRRDVSLYENCGMCTGAYLVSLALQRRSEKDPALPGRMRRTYEALRRIYRIGDGQEHGYFPKIYGDRLSPETSSDQYLYAMIGMDAYFEYADPEEQREIRTMIPAMAEFWLRHNYIRSYFRTRDLHWPLVRFPIFMLMAARYSGKPEFRAEYKRLLTLWEDGYIADRRIYFRPAPEYRRLFGPESRAEDICVACGMQDYTTMRANELEYLLLHDPANRLAPAWRAALRDGWEQSKLVLTPEGKAMNAAFVDRRRGEFRPATASGRRSSRSGWSSMIIRAAFQALRFLPSDGEIRATGLRVLDQLDLDSLTYWDDADQLPANLRFKSRFLSGDAVTNWLWAYWLARDLKLIP